MTQSNEHTVWVQQSAPYRVGDRVEIECVPSGDVAKGSVTKVMPNGECIARMAGSASGVILSPAGSSPHGFFRLVAHFPKKEE